MGKDTMLKKLDTLFTGRGTYLLAPTRATPI
jgi:hypothetical protein